MQVVLYFQSPSQTSAPEKLAGVRKVIEKRNWHLQIIEGLPNASRLCEILEFWQPLGVIVECGGGYDEIDYDRFRNIPTVFLDRNPDTLPPEAYSVSHDSRATARMAAKELLTIGYDNYAYIHPERHTFWSDDREKGFREALTLNGKTSQVFYPPTDDSGYGYQKALREFIQALEKPCAIFAANDKTAAEAITVATLAGFGIPEEIAVIGVDNFTAICEHTKPNLTSVEPDFFGGGADAAMMLISIIGKRESVSKERYRHYFGPLRVIHRQSTRLLRVYDKEVMEALELIAKEACQGLKAADVLKIFSCSRQSADRHFKRAVGRTILDEIQCVRLARAKELLRNSHRQIKAISDFCGFKTANALRKFFQKETGMTMSAWRKENKI